MNADVPSPATSAWSVPAEAVLRQAGTNASMGLNQTESRTRLQHYGPNRLREVRRRSALGILLSQFLNLMMALLGVAALLAFLFVDWAEGVAILAVILINVAIGFITELKAERSMAALYRLGQVTARVRREGHVRTVPAAELVPGDIVLVEGGDVVSADMRLLQTSRLQVNESALTGESVPVDKSVDAVAAGSVLGDRTCMLYKGTAVVRGSAEAVVTGTGLATELGAITALVEKTEDTATPLEARLDRLARGLILVTFLLTAVVTLVGIFTGRGLVLMLQTGVALAIATVPEGLPIVATVALARGMWHMARKKALITRLSAVETLGATSVICTDKTGTLTENRMTAVHLLSPASELCRKQNSWPAIAEESPLHEAIKVAALCNNAELDDDNDDDGNGDPMEIALLRAAAEIGIHKPALIAQLPKVREEAFDTDTRMMATVHRDGTTYRYAIKGAPESVIAQCTRTRMPDGSSAAFDAAGREYWLQQNTRLAAAGLRVLALATKREISVDAEPYADLEFLGLVGLIDPPRPDVADAIRRCRDAGIQIVVVTGDHAETALHVARDIGLMDDDDAGMDGRRLRPADELDATERERLLRTCLFARVDPRQKVNLIGLHQHAGRIVAMTGDGVNDAPALKKADIGIAMGLRGTQVAREAADMILKDDAFGTIVAAVEQGRVIFDNIRKFVVYLLSCNVSEVLIVTLAMLAGAPLPLLPLQILFLNLVTDVFPALALGVGAGDTQIMQRRPRPANEPVLASRHWCGIAGYGALMTGAVLASFLMALHYLDYEESAAVTVSFFTLALAQLWHVFNMRTHGSGCLRNDVTRNPWVWGALLCCALLLLVALHVPALTAVLQLVSLDNRGWLLVFGFSLTPLLAGQLYHVFFLRE